MKLRPVSLATLALLSALATSALADEQRRGYIVRLADEPVLSYGGGVSGYAATQPVQGQRFVFHAEQVQAYVGYLSQKQQDVIALVGSAPVYANFTTVLNGFAARLTDAEVLALQAHPMVRNVQVDEIRHVTTSTTPKFLGLSEPGGLWSQTVHGGLDKGEDIVIGVIDTGVWPENPAFADHVDADGTPTFNGGTLAYGPPPASFTGACVAGEGLDPAKHCNNKLIGAKVFNAGLFAAGESLHWSEFNSARDSLGSPSGHGGHGTHTASTAGGNSGAPAVIGGVLMGKASGMAPRARVAVYKVCNTYASDTSASGQNSCFSSDSVAAIEEAVKDGVNVINYSISGSQTTVNDAVEQAFLKASNAGVFVAAAAGNAGPDNTVNHASPWLTTVAASTHDRLNKADLTLGSGVKYSGASVNVTALPAKPLILSVNAALPGANLTEANLCYLKSASSGAAVLDPAKVSGKIVVCSRGTNPRVEKSQAVGEAGGVGMIMADDGNGLVAEAHAVPTIHVSQADGSAIKGYAAGGTGTSTLGSFYAGTTAAPIMAAFSSRGPNKADANVLKPDLAAPGVDVIAGVAPGLTAAERNAVAAGTLVPRAAWVSMQGTSMATPHVSGLAALLKQAHPDWSPAAIKSALATTTRSTLDDKLPGMQNGLLPWSQGTGNVQPNKATDPGLVYDAGETDWIRYLCNVAKSSVSAEDCTNLGTLDATYNLNLPSITVANVPGAVTVTRKVTNVSASTSTYQASASLPNFNVAVTPASLTLAPGESKSFTVTLTNVDALDGIWKYGSLVWSDGAHAVTSPISVKMGKSITAPEQVIANSASGSRLMSVKTGFAGRMTMAKAGLKDVTMGPVNLLAPYKYTGLSLGQACQGGGSYFAQAYDVVIPAGTIVARWALRQEDVGTVNDDHDLIVLDPNGKSYVSGNAGSNESVQLINPLSGNYRVCVGAYSGGINGGMSHRLSSWIVGPNDLGGKFTVLLPAQVYAGGTATVGISWSGLSAGKRYFGGAVFKDPAGVIQTGTAVRVETNGGVPVSEEPRVVSTKDLAIPY